MDFVIGCLLTFIILFVFFAKKTEKRVNSKPFLKIRYSQTHIHSLVRPLLPTLEELKSLNKTSTQTRKHVSNNHIKVLIIDNQAYWTKNNVVYVADIDDGDIDKDNARVVDTMGMSKVELDKMLFIIDRLKDGIEDDSSNSGK
jgi:hypothetical protein